MADQTDEPAPSAEWPFGPPPPFPTALIVAGILWLLVGAAMAGLFGYRLARQLPIRWYDYLPLVGGLIFLKDGVQLIRGRLDDPGFDGWCSVAFGLLAIGAAGVAYARTGNIVALYGAAALSPALLVSGGLVLTARTRYQLWQAWRGPR